MVQRTCRLRNLSVIILLTLTICNILMTFKYMYAPECSKNLIHVQNLPLQHHRSCSNTINLNTDGPFPSLNLRLGRWDNTMTYKYFDSLLVGDRYSELGEDYSVCLATQSSIEKMFSLVQVANHWSGPISATVFAAGDDELNILLQYIMFLRKCYVNIKDRVNFHLALPKNRMPNTIKFDLTIDLDHMDCLKPDVTLKQLLKERSTTTEKWRKKYPYPQNHLRNVARKNCQTDYVFLTDVDIIPSYRMAEELDKFLRHSICKNKCAYVIPTYELDERVRFPSNKTELIRLANKGLARPFHQKVFIFNQFATNFSRWQSTIQKGQEVQVSHPVTNFEFLYEPFYVAPDTAPPHDERFLGYGYTRNTQVYEMFVAGYEFLVLSPVFTCHWGLQLKRGRPAWREQQNNQNRRKFDAYKQEIFIRYGRDPLNMIKVKT